MHEILASPALRVPHAQDDAMVDINPGASRVQSRFMANTSPSDFPAKGRVTEIRGDSVVFQPSGTVYELLLRMLEGATYDWPINVPISATIRLGARKVYTVPSGGNFIEPICGQPRIIQGRVRAIEASGRA